MRDGDFKPLCLCLFAIDTNIIWIQKCLNNYNYNFNKRKSQIFFNLVICIIFNIFYITLYLTIFFCILKGVFGYLANMRWDSRYIYGGLRFSNYGKKFRAFIFTNISKCEYQIMGSKYPGVHGLHVGIFFFR